MTTLTSVLNYGALITLSCCNAVLQIAAAPACGDPAQESAWPSCAPDAGSADGVDHLIARLHGGGKLYLVEGEGAGKRKPVDSTEWRTH